MESPTYRLILCAAHLILFAGLCEAFRSSSEAKKNSLQNGVTVSSKNVGGAIEVKINATRYGNIKVYLPDDLRAGDTISGTLVTEPKGNTPEEIAKNKSELENYNVGLGSETVSVTEVQFTVRTPTMIELPASRPNVLKLALLSPKLSPEPVAPKQPPNFIIDGAGVDIPLYDPPKVNAENITFFPLLSQQGRAAEIHGPFDGNLANTGLTRRIGEGSAGPIRVLAESPRKIVFVAPEDVIGPYSITVNEGGKPFTGDSRNIAVRLSAPKTNLLRGEKTTVTIEVSGLAGIIKDVPLQLDARGVINMDGGNFQNLRIKPEEVKLDGRYTTNRTINALQAGGFSVTATVIVGPFDICLQDDVDSGRGVRWNTFTGDYAFTNPVPPKPPDGTAQAGGTTATGAGGSPPAGVNLTGIGKPTMKGCIITLSHNAPDRRVFARLDTCTKTGDASVETNSPKKTFEIKDKNTADDTCPPQPPK